MFAASSFDVAGREQYAAMEAGGGAVAAPPKKGSSKTCQPQTAAAENRDCAFSARQGAKRKGQVRFSCLCAHQGFLKKKQLRKQQRKTR